MEPKTKGTPFGSYKVNDRRGREAVGEPCRVCGCPIEHSKEYGKPTMNCIIYLRESRGYLEGKLERALSSLRSYDPKLADHIEGLKNESDRAKGNSSAARTKPV